MIINHVGLENDWYRKELVQNAKTLILGSFNPYNPREDNADYYYGRGTNYFWKAIAEINQLNPNFFFNNLDRKIEYMTLYRFCFLDVINSVEISSDDNNDLIINSFINRKIYKEFSDQVLFTTNTSFENTRITVRRVYNYKIFELLLEGRIQKIIHTMGNNTIGNDFITKWQENRLGVNGFQGFINKIKNQANATFVSQSFSPSGRAIKAGGQNYFNELKLWLNEHVIRD